MTYFRLLLTPSIIKARQLYYELGVGTGGSVMGRNTEASAAKILADHAVAEANGTAPKMQRRFADAPAAIRRAVGENLDFNGAPPQSRVFGDAVARL